MNGNCILICACPSHSLLLRTLLICIGHSKLTVEFCVSAVLSGSYTVCMGYLMKFPRVYDDVYHYVKAALAMRENKVSCD